MGNREGHDSQFDDGIRLQRQGNDNCDSDLFASEVNDCDGSIVIGCSKELPLCIQGNLQRGCFHALSSDSLSPEGETVGELQCAGESSRRLSHLIDLRLVVLSSPQMEAGKDNRVPTMAVHTAAAAAGACTTQTSKV